MPLSSVELEQYKKLLKALKNRLYDLAGDNVIVKGIEIPKEVERIVEEIFSYLPRNAYIFESILAIGGESVIFLVKDFKSGKLRYCLKLAFAEFNYDHTNTSRFWVFRTPSYAKERFIRGVKTQIEASSLFEQNLMFCIVPKVIEYSVSPPIYAVMQYIEGELYEDFVMNSSLRDALVMFYKILWGFKILHSEFIVHRDVKPNNFLVLPNRQVAFLDFNLAKPLSEDKENLTVSGDIFGSLLYSPPELLTGHGDEADWRTDIYSLGWLLYFTLTRTPPPKIMLRKNIHQHARKLLDPFKKVFLKSTAYDIKDREYSVVDDFIQDFEKAFQEYFKTKLDYPMLKKPSRSPTLSLPKEGGPDFLLQVRSAIKWFLSEVSGESGSKTVVIREDEDDNS